MAHLHKKIKKGRPYYYVREIERINGKPTVVSQVYLGSPERILELLGGKDKRTFTSLSSKAFGSLFIFNDIDKAIGLSGIIDSVVVPSAKKKHPTIGEYCYYAVLNRIIEPLSKMTLPEWYRATDIQNICPIDIESLDSKTFWDKWDRVGQDEVREIVRRFFSKVRETVSLSGDCLLFDVNYSPCLPDKMGSDLRGYGKNKDSKHHMTQIGLTLLVDRGEDIPLYYRLYYGGRHDSDVFKVDMEELCAEICSWNKTKQRLTVVFDEGVNSEANIKYIDDQQMGRFITSYPVFLAEEFAGKDLQHFSPLDTENNKHLRESGQADEQVLSYRGMGEFWGKDRAVIVIYNPGAYRKKKYDFEQKIERVREDLLKYRKNYQEHRPHWRDKKEIQQRYHQLCEDLYIDSRYYELTFDKAGMSFSQDPYQIEMAMKRFGKNIIVTNNTDWTTEKIYLTYHEHSKIEQHFRKSKSPFSVAVTPQYHWTDSKIQLYMLTSVVGMVYFALFRNKLKAAHINMSAEEALRELRNLKTAVYVLNGCRKLQYRIEDPTERQNEVLKAFGYAISDGRVLQLPN